MWRSRFAIPAWSAFRFSLARSGDLDAAVILDRAHRRDDYRGVRLETGLAALDVHEFLGTEVRAEAGLCHDVVGELERSACCHHGVAAVSDVRERTAVDESRIVFERLHQVGRERVLEERRHRAVRLDVLREDWLVLACVADDDPAEPLLEVLEARCQAEDRHHLGGDDDVEAILARIAIAWPAESDRDVAERTVVDVDDAAPGDAAHVEACRVAVIDVVVDHGREQIVRECDGGEVAREVEIDVLHGHDLRVTPARGAALHAEDRAECRLAETNDRLLADTIERIAKADGHCRLAFARRSGGDGRDQDELAVLALVEVSAVVERDLRLVVAEGLQL